MQTYWIEMKESASARYDNSNYDNDIRHILKTNAIRLFLWHRIFSLVVIIILVAIAYRRVACACDTLVRIIDKRTLFQLCVVN